MYESTFVLFSLFIFLFLVHVPIGVSLAASCIITMMVTTDFTLYMLANKMFVALDAEPLMAIPGFIMAGAIMAEGGISKYLIAAMRAWVGHFQGGMSIVTVASCSFFAAISGSSPATAAAIGSIMVPGMIQAGYDKRYAMGLVAASGTLGILIPPSITFVLFAIATDTSIGRLFTAGILPGIVLSIVLMIMAYVVAKIKGYGGEEKVSWSKRWKITAKALPGLFLPVIILGTIYGGIATPTESSIISVFYAILVSVFIYRELTWKQFQRSVREGVGITAMIFMIIAAASVFALFLTDHQIPKAIINWALMSGKKVTVVSFWIFTQLLFLVLGTFLEAVAIVLITLPILAPLAVKLDINLYHFAVVMVVNMELAMITPPVGLNLFVISTIARARLGEVVRGVAPFIVIMILVLILFVIFPQISLYLPDLIMGPLKSLR